ncbi:DUF1488 family protein [Xylophilus sp. Kf1]|nr:DUF1488 family protein [Xylophilus sp. Kf1]
MKRALPWVFAPDRFARRDRPVRRNTSIGGLSFGVEIDGENIPMRISEQALRKVFAAGRSPSTWLEAYRRNAGWIDSLAMAAHREDPSRPVCLEVEDFSVPRN